KFSTSLTSGHEPCRLTSASTTEDRAQNAAHEFPTNAAADGAHRALGRRIEQGVVAAAAAGRGRRRSAGAPKEGLKKPRLRLARRRWLRARPSLAVDAFQAFISRLSIHNFFVGAIDQRTFDGLTALGGGDGAQLAVRRTDESALHDARLAFLIEE